MQREIVSRVTNLHLADNLRANKSTMAFSLEARVPFLDRDFIDVVMAIDPMEKMHRHSQKDAEGTEGYRDFFALNFNESYSKVVP